MHKSNSRQKGHKKCKQKQSRMFNFCNIFDLLTSRTPKIARYPPAFKPDFHIFPYNEQLRKILRNFIDKLLLYHASLNLCLLKEKCQKYWNIKGAFSGLRQFLATEIPLKTIKSVFYFTLNISLYFIFSFSRYLNFCPDFLAV